MDSKQQFNIYLPSELIKKVKYAAIDYDKSLSGFVEDALELYLKAQKVPTKNLENFLKENT